MVLVTKSSLQNTDKDHNVYVVGAVFHMSKVVSVFYSERKLQNRCRRCKAYVTSSIVVAWHRTFVFHSSAWPLWDSWYLRRLKIRNVIGVASRLATSRRQRLDGITRPFSSFTEYCTSAWPFLFATLKEAYRFTVFKAALLSSGLEEFC